MDEIFHKTFKYAKQLAREFYFRVWAKSPPQCLAFGGEVVHVTREGWEHIIDDTARTRTDVLGRLFTLERAKKLLEEAATFQDHRERTDLPQKVEYWMFEAVIAEVKVRVIVRSIAGGPKHFLSVVKKGTIERELV